MRPLHGVVAAGTACGSSLGAARERRGRGGRRWLLWLYVYVVFLVALVFVIGCTDFRTDFIRAIRSSRRDNAVGLYDPVLDDSEYVYVPFELDDLDQESNTDQLKDIKSRSEETVVEPTVLKLNYKDVFPELNVDELPSQIKYRLPISEQYDPEGKKVSMLHGYNKHSFVDVEQLNYLAKKYAQFMENKDPNTGYETSDKAVFKTQKLGTNECNYFQRNEDEIDLSQIAETASYVVDNNLDRAFSAANKIKKEIGTKLDKMAILKEMTSKSYEKSVQTEQTYKEHLCANKKIAEAKSFITNADNKYTKETSSTEKIKKEVSVAEEIKKFETLDVQMDSILNIEERKLLRQQDIEEAIDAGTVRQRTEMFKKEPGSKKLLDNDKFKIVACNENTPNFNLSKQHIYNLGLQIIPHIQKATQISKHGHLILKIFIMQLTKVMIALSRFILLHKNKYLHENSDSFMDVGEIIKKSKLSGAQIARIEGLKPAELTNKMDVVISEFLRKCGKEEKHFEAKYYSSSQSRSRSNSKSDQEEVITNGVFFKPKTIINEKKTLQEIYESKKNSVEMREIKSEKRYSEFRSSKMDSNVNLYENEIKPVDDGNLIYIAIVEAHVYTNKDAIFGEQFRRMSENRYESDALDLGKVYYRCEVSVTYRDFRESSLPPTVIIESIEEIPCEQVYEEEKQEAQQTSVLGFEEIAKKLAVQKITEVLEPLLMIKEVKSVNIKNAYPVIEMPLKTMIETSTLAMEKEKNIFQGKLWSEKSHASIEKPVKSVVETSVVSVQEDESGFVDILEFTQHKPQSIIERTTKSIAETTEFIEDEKVEAFDCTQQPLRTPHPVIERSVKSVAEITQIITDETKTNILNISKPLSIIPQYTISNNSKSVAETITTAEEAETDILNISKSMSITPRCAVSNNLLAIAETFSAATEEPKQDNIDIAKLSKKIVTVGIDKNFATQVVETFSEEPVPEEIVTLEIKGRRSDGFFEKPLLILPETNTVFTEDPISERLSLSKSLTKEAKKNIQLGDIPMCAEVTEIIFSEKEQSTFDVASALEIERIELREKPVLSVVTTAIVLPFEPKEKPLNIDKLKIQDARITLEESQATEIALIRSEEPKPENLNIFTVNNKCSNINMESSMLSVAEKLSVPLHEPDYEDLEIPNFDLKSSQKLIQDTGLPVAESFLIVPNSPESVDFIVSDTTNEQAKIIVDESVATTTSVIYLEEPKSENLELPIVKEKQPRFSVQDCALTLVTKGEILPESPKYDDLTPFIYEKDIGKSKFDECMALLATITSYEEPKHENMEVPRINKKQFKTIIETPHLKVAETSAVGPQLCVDSFDTEGTVQKGTTNFVEIHNCVTTEITAVEPKEKHFEVPIIKSQNLVTRMEEVHLSTAESSLIIPEISTNIFDSEKIDKHHANVDMVENKGMETFLVRSLESNYDNLGISAVAKNQSETLIEKPVLIVAETATAVPEECCNNSFETKFLEEKAMVNRALLENYITSETTVEECIKNHVEAPVINHQKLLTDIQRVNLSTAESSITIPETHIKSFEAIKVESHQAHKNIVQEKAVEGSVECPVESHDKLKISAVLRHQPDILVETSVLTAAETSMNVTAESCNDSLQTKISDEKATVNFVEIHNCETSEITAQEPKEEHFEESVIKQHSLVTNMEKVHLLAAESSSIIPEISIYTFDARKTDIQSVNTDVLEHKGIETFFVHPLEPNYESLEISTVVEKQPQTLIERPVLVVAETEATVPEELCNHNFETKIVDEKAMVNRLLLENYITTETIAEEAIEKYVEIPVINNQRLQTDIQRVPLSSVESSITIPETDINSFESKTIESHEANINIVEEAGIEGTSIWPMEPHYVDLEISSILKNKLDTSVEAPVLTVAEISIVAIAESCNDNLESKILDEKATFNIILMQNSETIETSTEEPKEQELEIPIINHQSFEISTEEAHLSIAQSSLIIPCIAANTFDAKHSESQKVRVDIVEQKGVASILICPWEPHCEEIEIPKAIKKKLDTHIETPILFVAETLTVIPVGHCDDKFDSRMGDKQGSVHVVAFQNYVIAETIAEGPRETKLEILATNHQKLKAYLEELFLSAAEMSSVIPDLSLTYFDATKTEIQQIHVNIVEQKSIETFCISPVEPNFENLEITKVTANQLETLIESSFLNVAETFKVILEEPYHESFETKVTDVQATVNINAIHTYEITEVTVEEPKEKTLEISATNQLRVQSAIEDFNLSVAELSFIVPDISIHIFDTEKSKSQQVHINVVKLKSVETFVLCPWEANFEDLKISKPTSIQSEILVESPVLIVAEILTTVVEGPHIDKFEEKIFYEQAEVNLIAIQLPGVFQITAEEPKEMNFETPVLTKLKLEVGLEDVYLMSAESFIVLTDESVHIMKSRKMESQNVLIDVVEQKAIAISFVVVWEANYEDSEVQEIIKKVPQTLIVSSFLAVAENLAFVFEEKVHEDFKTIKASVCQAATNFVKLKVAVKYLVFSEGPRQEIFERPKLFMLEPQFSVVDKYLTVAEIQSILPIEQGEKLSDSTDIINQYAHFAIEEYKIAVSSIIFIEEPNIEEFITKGLVTNESENLIELTAKPIAQVIVINICEKEIEFIVPSQAVLRKVNIGFEALKPVAQKFLIFAEDSKQDVCEYCKFKSYQVKTTVVESAATAVSQTIIPNVAKHQLQKLTKAMERKHEVDITEIVDSKHDEKNIDSIDITKYNVELANEYEESILTQQEKANYSKDVDLITLSSVSTSSSISSAPSSPLIEEYVFGVKGHEYRVHSPQETSLDVISTHVDTGYKTQNMDTSMTIAIEAAIDKFRDIDVKKREFWISDVKINTSMESADVNMNIMKSNMSLETAQSSKYHSLQDLQASSALVTKNRALSYDQAADFEVALESKDNETRNSDSQDVAIFDFRTGASFESAKDLQSTEANLNIKMKSAKTMTAENIDVTYGLTLEREIMDYDQSIDSSVQISHESNTAKTNKRKVKKEASKQISLEKSKLLSIEKSASIKESYTNLDEEINSAYSSAMKGNLKSKSILLEKSTISMEMDAAGQTGLNNIEIFSDGQSPSPPIVPSTPLTDYYIFRLQSPYPEETTFVPRDCSFTPESSDEDSLIITNGLIPHIDTKIERILYSPPLQTPDASPEKHTEIIFTESELKGSAQGQKFTKVAIKDIGRKSSLRASVIDKTIRSTEEYKESVGVSGKKVDKTRRVDNIGVQKVELNADVEAINAGQVEISGTDASERFQGSSETKGKGLKMRTVTHKGLATSISEEQSMTETQQNKARRGKSESSKSSRFQSSGSESHSSQSSGIQSSNTLSTGIQLNGIQSSSIQSTGIQSSVSKSSSIQSSGIQSSGIQLSSIQSSSTKSGSSQSSGIRSSGIQSSSSILSRSQSTGIQSSSIQSSGIQSSGIQSSHIQSSDIQSSSNKSSGIQSRSIKSSSSQSTGIQSSGIQSSGIQSSHIQSSEIQSSSNKSSGIQSRSIKSSSSQSTGIQSSGIQSSGIQSSHIQSSEIQSSSNKSSGIKSSVIQSSGIQSSGIQSSDIQSSGIQSSGIQSTGIQSSNSKSGGIQSTGIQSSSSKSGSFQSSGIQSRGIQSSSNKSSRSQSTGIQSSSIQLSGIQSSHIQSSGMQSSSSKSSGIQSRSIQSSAIQSSGIQSSGIQSSGVRSSGIQSSSIQSSGIESSSIQSSGSQSSSSKSNSIQSSNDKSTSSKSSSTLSDQKLHLLSKFS